MTSNSADSAVAAETKTKSRALAEWVANSARLTQPDNIVWCDGSEAERRRLTEEAVAAGVLIPLNREKRPSCYLHRSNPNDVARTEEVTFICTPTARGRGSDQQLDGARRGLCEARRAARRARCAGRTMYVVPYVMGPLGSPFAKVGVEITDSIYVALSMRIMTRMGAAALEMLGDFGRFQSRPALHARPRSRSGASSAISRRTTRSGRSAAAMAATRC